MQIEPLMTSHFRRISGRKSKNYDVILMQVWRERRWWRHNIKAKKYANDIRGEREEKNGELTHLRAFANGCHCLSRNLRPNLTRSEQGGAEFPSRRNLFFAGNMSLWRRVKKFINGKLKDECIPRARAGVCVCVKNIIGEPGPKRRKCQLGALSLTPFWL